MDLHVWFRCFAKGLIQSLDASMSGSAWDLLAGHVIGCLGQHRSCWPPTAPKCQVLQLYKGVWTKTNTCMCHSWCSTYLVKPWSRCRWRRESWSSGPRPPGRRPALFHSGVLGNLRGSGRWISTVTGPHTFLGDTAGLHTGCKRRTFWFHSPGSCDQGGIYKGYFFNLRHLSLDTMQKNWDCKK